MTRVHFLTHPDVIIDPTVPIPDWPLSPLGEERLRGALNGPCFKGITALHSSTERKAIDATHIIADALTLPFQRHADLGENDRSSTGYLPREEFEHTADQFFNDPTQSVRGWTPAANEQARMVKAVRRICAEAKTDGTILVISHGAVGALLIADLLDRPISRSFDQPGDGGGNWFAFDGNTWSLFHQWSPMSQ